MNEKERKKLQQNIIGPVVPLNIPFKDDYEIDFPALEKYVDFLARKKVHTIILTYGSSEYANLSDDEIYEITKVVAEVNAGRSIFVSATKAWSVKKSLEYIDFSKKCGAHSVKIQPSYSGFIGKLDQDNLYEYFKLINAKTSLPLWAYTIPQAGKHPGMTSDTWRRIAQECTNVYAMKTDGDMMYGMYSLIQASKDRAMMVSGGQMKSMIYGWPLGAKAYLCPIAFFMPEISLLFTELMTKGDVDKAIKIIHDFEDTVIALCSEIDWLALAKGILHVAGFFNTPKTRLPLKTADRNQLVKINELYIKLSELKEKYEVLKFS